MLETVIIEPNQKHKISIIWLHGLGADGHDFEPIAHELNLKETFGVKFIFPHAPMRPITINNGMMMRGWFDIHSLQNIEAESDYEGIYASCGALCDLIADEIKQGISPQNIYLAGFSQGGVVALLTGLTYDQPLGGILALSTYLVDMQKSSYEINPINQSIPIFLAHGKLDDVLPFHFGEITMKRLQSMHTTVEWHEYIMSHSVCNEEINDIARWFSKLMAGKH